ncbi:Hypothetical_protein [Hexamita inflata]|uniref:Hypothetical_protein n=1 Tax=Hexamita inflata TaxID=28002 RepID=A0AA86RSF4_9EUKA|nr:Hypothetical protein HINF_LOCUS64809 [Hexamita inflata]
MDSNHDLNKTELISIQISPELNGVSFKKQIDSQNLDQISFSCIDSNNTQSCEDNLSKLNRNVPAVIEIIDSQGFNRYNVNMLLKQKRSMLIYVAIVLSGLFFLTTIYMQILWCNKIYKRKQVKNIVIGQNDTLVVSNVI